MNGSLLAAVFHLSVACFLLGMGWRCFRWLRAPVPLRIPLTPAPVTTGGVIARLAREAFAFRALFRADAGFWIVAWLFHFSLVLLFIGHFGGLLAPELSRRVLGLTAEQFAAQARVSGSVIGLLSAACVLWLLLRRVRNERLRYLSTAADYFLLSLLLVIIATGLAMRLTGRPEIGEVRAFVLGLHRLAPPSESPDALFTLHLLSVSALLIYAPFSKLVHMAGLFFNPALNQTNNPRDRRHAARAGMGGPRPQAS